MKCRHCQSKLSINFLDLGSSPPSNSYLSSKALSEIEIWYPLKVLVCEKCWLVQTEDFVREDAMFSADYAYYSSYSTSWLNHAKKYVQKMTEALPLNKDSLVVEVAANDGYLLQYVKEKGIGCYGIEPTLGTAQAAKEKGIEIIEEFFGVDKAIELCKLGRKADLMVANNVLAHVPDINDFVRGFSLLLKPNGVATFENPHLLNLVENNQFDTVYHEHYSYLSLTSVNKIFQSNNLMIFDVEELPTHGGSLRYYAQHNKTGVRAVSNRVELIARKEFLAGLSTKKFYSGFQERANQVKYDLLKFLLLAKSEGKKVAAYGAAAKGNTLLNFAGVREDLLNYIVDKNPAKQGKFAPGNRIRITVEDDLINDQPDYVLILPWNLKDEIMEQLSYIKKWGGKFVVAVPKLYIIE